MAKAHGSCLLQVVSNISELYIILQRGATALLVHVAAIATGCNSPIAQAKYGSSFQLRHISCEDHTRSFESAMAAKGKTRIVIVLITSPAH